MTSALIGYTGFVGSNLLAQTTFTHTYNSKNIRDMRGQEYDLVVCSGAPAAKWIANQKPAEDLENLEFLMSVLQVVRAKYFVLISTIDAYKVPIEVDEDTAIDCEGLHPYGLHRYRLEEFVRDNFDAAIVRLPGLFGHGLKKNVIYDLINNNQVEKIHQDGSFQYYNLVHLWKDLCKIREEKIPLINLATEPLPTRELARECFGIELNNSLPPPSPRYDFRTKYAAAWGGPPGYLYRKTAVLEEMKSFVVRQKGR